MNDDSTTILSTSQGLRKKCIEAHNVFFKESGYSLLWEVRRSLEPDFSYKLNSPVHLLLSSYGFWGTFEIGGSRRGLEKRLERLASPPARDLHKRITKGLFGAWSLESVDGELQIWASLGPGEKETVEIHLVSDGKGQRASPNVGEVRAGWFVEGIEDEPAGMLLFSTSLRESAAKKLRKAAENSAWNDDVTAVVQRAEFERDILTLVVHPSWNRCGLDPFYFLPPTQRNNFPRQFGRQLPYEVVRYFREEGVPWHLRVVEEDRDFLVRNFDTIRKKAGRSARYYRGADVELPQLRRLISDKDFFRLIGLDKEGLLTSEEFPPLATHPLGLLDLDEAWFKATSLSPMTTVHQGRRHFEDAESASATSATSEKALFEEALTHHESRLRWVSLMRRIFNRGDEPIEDLPDYLQINRSPFRPDYAELRLVIDALFSHAIAPQPIAALLAGRGRGIKRIVKALEVHTGSTEVTVGDLPERAYQLHGIEGIGEKSFEMIEEALQDALLSWPAEFSHKQGAAEPEVREEIDQGLDELEALFGG